MRFRILRIFYWLLLLSSATGAIGQESAFFTNPILPHGQDPWIIKHEGRYYYCRAVGNGIAISVSSELHRINPPRKVWTCPKTGWNRTCVWAPELHRWHGKWYIIYAAGYSGPPYIHQRTGVLESVGNDPFGPYIDKGMIYTGDTPEIKDSNRWAIDMTLFKHKNKLYAVWSGWEKAESTDNTVQHLYIARMKNPWTPASPRIRISSPDTEYECNGQLPINEGPEILKSPSQLFIVYSCGQSWLDTYKLSWLRLRDKNADPLKPESWEKSPTPVFSGTESIHGVGHACFTTSPDDKEHYIVYHSKRDVQPGWERDGRIQRFEFDSAGYPCFGRPVPTGEPQKLPSGSSDELK